MTDGIRKALGVDRNRQILATWPGPDLVLFLLDQARAADGGMRRDNATAVFLQTVSTHPVLSK